MLTSQYLVNSCKLSAFFDIPIYNLFATIKLLMSNLLIKNGRIINYNQTFFSDILIENGLIKSIAKNIKSTDNIRVLDAKGMLLFPGGVDVHTHMELPTNEILSSDTFETGTKAAIYGGTTTIIDFANQTKGVTPWDALRKWEKKAFQKCYTDYSFHISITDLSKCTKEDIKGFINYGITSFKTFLAYEKMKLNFKELETLIGWVKEFGGLITVHAELGELIEQKIKSLKENKNLSPKYHALAHSLESETEAVKILIAISEKTQAPIYIVHVSSSEAIDLIKDAKNKGIQIFAETCPQYLILDNSVYNNSNFLDAAKLIMSPPLRSQEDLYKMWNGVIDNTIDTIATDHCPFNIADKRKGKNSFTDIPNGIPGVEQRFHLVYSEGVVKRGLSLNKFTDLISTNPAKIFGIYPQKGIIQIGSDADIVIFNPNTLFTIDLKKLKTNCDYSPYEGKTLYGQINMVIKSGEIVVKNQKILSKIKKGKFLKRSRFSETFPKLS